MYIVLWPVSHNACTLADTVLDASQVTVIKRGAAPVDEHSGKVDTHQVLTTAVGVWDAMLNQSDFGKNTKT